MNPMELFERYLQEVRKYLPWQRQDDIVAELRANLDAQREEREADLGRPLTEGEMVDWLKELGPPLEMAARYQPVRYLIGPTIFPLYLRILQLAALWMSVAYAVSIAARMLLEQRGAEWLSAQIGTYPWVLFLTAAWVTAAFAALEFISQRYPEKCPDFMAPQSRWSPTKLPPLEKQVPAGGKSRTLPAAVGEFVAQFALLTWMLLIPRHPYLLMGPGAAYLQRSPLRPTQISIVFFWTIVAFGFVQLAWQAYNFFANKWRIRSTVQHLTTKGLGLVPMLILLAAPQHRYIELNPPFADRLPAGFNIAAINHGVFVGVVVLTCIVAIQFAWDVWKARPGIQNRILRTVL